MILEDSLTNESLPKSLVTFCILKMPYCQVIGMLSCSHLIPLPDRLVGRQGRKSRSLDPRWQQSHLLLKCITCFLWPLKRQWYLGFLSDPDGKLLLKGVVMRLSKICFLLNKDHLALAFGAGCS